MKYAYTLFLKFSVRCIHPNYLFFSFNCVCRVCPNLSSAPCSDRKHCRFFYYGYNMIPETFAVPFERAKLHFLITNLNEKPLFLMKLVQLSCDVGSHASKPGSIRLRVQQSKHNCSLEQLKYKQINRNCKVNAMEKKKESAVIWIGSILNAPSQLNARSALAPR